MRKPEFIILLLKCGLCLPGTLNFSAKWYKSPFTVISITGIILTIGNGYFALINCPAYSHKPGSSVQNRTINPGEMPLNENAKPSIFPKMKEIASASTISKVCSVGHSSPFPVFINDSDSDKIAFDGDPGVIVEIALSGYQLLLFASNVLLRILVFASFFKLRNIFHELVISTECKRTEWVQAAQQWTTHEKVFVGLMVASLIEKEMDPISHIIHSLSSSCILDWSTFIFEIFRSQFQALFSLDFISESLTFALMGFIAAFVFLFDKESCEHGLSKNNKIPLKSGNQVNSLEKLFILNTPQNRIAGDSTVDGIKFAVSSGWNRKISSDPNYISSKADDTFPTESLQEQFTHKVDFYFDTVNVWRRCEFASGSVALIIFLELTTTFCLNTFIGIAAASATGAFNPRTLCSFLRAVIIIGKMICLATLAQTLPDSMHRFASRVLKIYWTYSDSDHTMTLPRRLETTKYLTFESDHMHMEDSVTSDKCVKDHNLSQIVAYIENNSLELCALGYFTISTSTLTSVFGVIITYLVVLIQFHLQILQSETSSN